MRKGVWLAALALGCGGTTAQPPTKDPAPSASTRAPAAASSSVAPPASEPTMPTLIPEEFTPGGSKPTGVFAIEGAVMVSEKQRVGRINGDAVDWVGSIPKAAAFGEAMVVWVGGRYPDRIDAFSESVIGRAPTPTFVPLTGKGTRHTEAPGGGLGIMHAARVGESTILATYSPPEGYRLITVRGPKLARRFTSATGKCKPDEVVGGFGPSAAFPALPPRAFESTTAGTLVSIGSYCERRGPTAEVWDKASGAARLVDLASSWKAIGIGSALAKGPGDELWAFGSEYQPILHYSDDKFAELPPLGQPIENITASPTGQLYVLSSNRTIFRFAGGSWSAVGRMTEPLELRTLAVTTDGTVYAGTGATVFKLREGPRERIPAASDCKTWFVYLYATNGSNDAKYTYPTTRKALASFPEAASLGLVEFGTYPRHMGVTVGSKAQGEAVIAHVRATMKDEDPRLFCYVPAKPRTIDLKAP